MSAGHTAGDSPNRGPYILSYDLGTGGVKAVLYRSGGESLASSTVAYETSYPKPGRHEQRPEEWWNAVVRSTHEVLERAGVEGKSVAACALSGHSLGVVPLGEHGDLLREQTPIWSDSRAHGQAAEFFRTVGEERWYMTTGNGFPPPLYSVFKIMWYREHEPELYRKIRHVVGTKDYVNYLLCGEIATDNSYASGSGVYDLRRRRYDRDLIDAAGISPRILPEPVPSTETLGVLSARAADQLGLTTGTKVIAGGVDNSCMAVGARNIRHGRVYNSLGSSSWIAVSSEEPILDEATRPFVFEHVIPGLYTSAYSIFSAGSSFRWIRDVMCRDLLDRARSEGRDVYDLMTEEAARAPVGSRGLLFNRNLAGGTGLDPSPSVRGAFSGLDLAHGREDLIRASMEGIAFGLREALTALREKSRIEDRMLVVGGGSSSPLWRRILADVYGMKIVKTSIDQDAAALGAAALAAVGTGAWDGFETIDTLHEVHDTTEPEPANVAAYRSLVPLYERLNAFQAELGDDVNALGLRQ